ncbi:polysaccharide pyruvyl transferase [Ruminiclostridium hungatei]|uniref:Polysaccharide pyruvyl transferase n=1 Tax=Ruminiclostridium hungatei TaxID=48256 RepID=A0A1V4SMZ3_RUMHU|nr:polysaccharide pyruvyl transferase family protein [Ruminiclostridium hungatei]OPX44825.1 polysaccharide pyruvyl transferase [Ruminiclostridium hungatei]
MKIGILTFHMAVNYGAYWQAYALNKYINDRYNIDCYLINYESRYTFKKDIIMRILNPNLPKGLYNLLAVANFRRGWKLMKKTRFSTNIKAHKFDGYILGSDEIWNYTNPFVEKGDCTYFGRSFEANKIMTFAPSFGCAGSSNITREITQSIARLNPDNISVRDENSQEIVEKLTGYKVPVLVDPVFLNEYTPKRIKGGKKFILVYGNNFDREFIDSIKEIAANERALIYSFGFINSFAHKNIVFKSPIEILDYFYSADYVFTNMYHGVVFSLCCKKQFFMQYNESKQNKVDTLLERIGLSDRVVCSRHEAYELYRHIKQNPYDFNNYMEKLQSLIQQSKDFIDTRIKHLNTPLINKSYRGA